MHDTVSMLEIGFMLGFCVVVFWIYDKYVRRSRRAVVQHQEEISSAAPTPPDEVHMRTVDRLELERVHSWVKLHQLRQRNDEVEKLWGRAFERFCALDIETTGIRKSSSRVIQVALILFDAGKPNGRRSWYTDPECPMPRNASKVNQIFDADVRGKGNFRHHAEILKKLLERYPLVGHNLYFDVSLLHEEFRRLGQSLKVTPLYCTMRNAWYAAAIAPPTKRRKRTGADALPWQTLGNLASSLGVVPTGRLHDAEVDARLAGECFVALAEAELSPIRKRLRQAESEYNQMLIKLADARGHFNRPPWGELDKHPWGKKP
jgi:DNA polymerase-3 subunit epsilon